MKAIADMHHAGEATRSTALMPRDPRTGAPYEEIAMMALDERGKILDCNRASERLFKYLRHEMVWRHVSMLLPQLANCPLVKDGQINPRLRFFCRLGRDYRAVTRDGEDFSSRLYFNCVDNTPGYGGPLLILRLARNEGEGAASH